MRQAIERAIETARAGRRRARRRQGARAGPGGRGTDHARSTIARSPVRPCAGWRRARDPARARRDRGALPGAAWSGRPERPSRRACRSTRGASPAGDLFVAVGGGEAFVGDAMARGAAAALVPDDAFAALAALGRAVRDRSEATVVAHHRLDGEDVDEGHPRRHLQALGERRSRPRRATTTSSASR